jgi:hypothetical protein
VLVGVADAPAVVEPAAVGSVLGNP